MTSAQEAYEWIIRIINSCDSRFHFDGAWELIALFRNKYQDKEGEYINRRMVEMLTDLVNDKFQKRFYPPINEA